MADETTVPEEYDYDGEIVEQAPADADFHILKCPVRDGERRPSFKCGATCANDAWSDDKADEVRSQCPAWEAFMGVVDEGA